MVAGDSATGTRQTGGFGVSGNDLMHVPIAPCSGEMVFRGGAVGVSAFWQIVTDNPVMAGAKGVVLPLKTRQASGESQWAIQVTARIEPVLF